MSMKKASTKERITTAKKLPTLEIEVVRMLPKLLATLSEKVWTIWEICPWRLLMPRVLPMLLIKPMSPVAVSKTEGRLLKNLMDSLMIVGTTMERNVIMKPTISR